MCIHFQAGDIRESQTTTPTTATISAASDDIPEQCDPDIESETSGNDTNDNIIQASVVKNKLNSLCLS